MDLDISNSTVSILGVCITVSLMFLYLIVQAKVDNTKRVDLRDLVVDWQTGRLDYKKLALNCSALCQMFTWLRMSMGANVHHALENPVMWIVFYAVIAGHDLLNRFIKIYYGGKGNDTTDTTGGGDRPS